MEGKEIAAERIKRSLSQRELASMLDVSESTVGNWETGRTSADRSLPLLLDVFASIPPKAEAANGSSGGVSLSTEQRERLAEILRSARQSIDQAIDILVG